MTSQAPLVQTLKATAPARALTVDGDVIVCEAPFAGTVTGVSYTPEANVTGANTDTRTIAVANKAQDGSGSTSVASLALTSGVNMVAFDEKALTLSGTAANLVVAAGDILEFTSTHAGSTGLADPGGMVQVEFTRS